MLSPLFVGVALAITAVPVLAGIIEEKRLGDTVTGVVAMTSAGVIDALGWLALSAALLGAHAGAQRPWWMTVALLVGYLGVMLLLARPALRYWIERSRSSVSANLPVVATFAMASACVTGALGLHVIIGAFLAGLIMPRRRDGAPHPELGEAMERAGGVLLPVFFVVSGLSTDIGSLRRADVGLLVVICVIATAGKLGAATLGARASRLGWNQSIVVGVLLNTRGLTELVALNVGLQAGIIGPRLYTIFVLMALITTVATGPLLSLVSRRRPDRGRPANQSALVATGGAQRDATADVEVHRDLEQRRL